LIAPGDVYVICHSQASSLILAECDEFHELSDGDDGFCLVKGSPEDHVVLDCVGNWLGDPGAGWDMCGVAEATMDHTLIRSCDVFVGSGPPDAGALDDGSCQTVTAHVVTLSWGNEVMWHVDDGDTYGPYSNNDDITEELCLYSGDHVLNYFDDYGDGWHDGYIELLAADGSNIVEPIFVVGSGGTQSFDILASVIADIGEENCEWTVRDKDYWDHRGVHDTCPAALVMQGGVGTVTSCPVLVDTESVCDNDWSVRLFDNFGDGWNGATLHIDRCCDQGAVASGLTIATGADSLEAVCISVIDIEGGIIVSAGGGAWDSEITWELVNAEGGIYLEAGAGTVSTCPSDCPGCVNIVVHVVTAAWGNEVIWNIDDGQSYGPYSDNADITVELCLVPGAHDLHYEDTYGDGWHGGYIEVLAADDSLIVEPIHVELYGASLPFVLLGEGTATPVCGGGQWNIHLVDAFGDGWNGASLSVEDCCGNLLQGGVSMGSGSSSVADLCVPPANDGFTIIAGGGSWDEEISWSLVDAEGVVEVRLRSSVSDSQSNWCCLK
jgi:hypothetical protein